MGHDPLKDGLYQEWDRQITQRVRVGAEEPPEKAKSPLALHLVSRKNLVAVSASIFRQEADEAAQKDALRNWLYNNHPQILTEFQAWWQAQKKK